MKINILQSENIDNKWLSAYINEGMQRQTPQAGTYKIEEKINQLINTSKILTANNIEDERVGVLLYNVPTGKAGLPYGNIKFIYSSVERQGIGKSLIREFAKLMKERGVQDIVTDMSDEDKRTKAFYLGLGFKITETDKFDDGFILHNIQTTVDTLLENTTQ